MERRFRLEPRRWNWQAYIWLVYLFFPIVILIIESPPAWVYLAEAGVLAAFLACYFALFQDRCQRYGWHLIGAIIAIAVVGCLWVTEANWGLFVYAASFAGYHASLRRSAAGIGLVVATVALLAALGGIEIWSAFACIPMCLTVGIANYFTARLMDTNSKLQEAREEIARLAIVAERDRIARDLHDLLGHTLSVIVLKAELARRLADRAPDQAAREIGEVEQISRDALSQVRAAVTGFRSDGIAAEWERSRAALISADIQVNHTLSIAPLSPAVEGTLAMVLREAVTNVLRHSEATQCRVSVDSGSGFVALLVVDNGRGVPGEPAGNGIRGMRERVLALGGTFEIGPDGDHGTRVLARLAA